MSTLDVKFNAQALAIIKAAAFAETQDTFELDIKPEAARRSPVTEAGMAHNEALKRKRPGGTGTNRRSIDVSVVDGPNGPHAELFTTSGYGGYLEVGTSRMAAQPYLYPAFVLKIKGLQERIKARIK